jgi:hypothetical protein
MPWEQSESASFRARHASADADDARRVLGSLEHVRVQLEQLFERVPPEITVVLHSRPAELVLSNPLIAARWLATEPAGRRYVAGWGGRRELHVLSPAALSARAAPVTGSPEMLRLTAAALYARRVIAESNPELAGAIGGVRTWRELRWAWLLEGCARWLAGQTAHARPAIARRLREGRRPSCPPGFRDAPLLGGTVIDLLAELHDERAVIALATRLPSQGPRFALERAFDARLGSVDAEWRLHLSRLATADR